MRVVRASAVDAAANIPAVSKPVIPACNSLRCEASAINSKPVCFMRHPPGLAILMGAGQPHDRVMRIPPKRNHKLGAPWAKPAILDNDLTKASMPRQRPFSALLAVRGARGKDR